MAELYSLYALFTHN